MVVETVLPVASLVVVVVVLVSVVLVAEAVLLALLLLPQALKLAAARTAIEAKAKIRMVVIGGCPPCCGLSRPNSS